MRQPPLGWARPDLVKVGVGVGGVISRNLSQGHDSWGVHSCVRAHPTPTRCNVSAMPLTLTPQGKEGEERSQAFLAEQ